MLLQPYNGTHGDKLEEQFPDRLLGQPTYQQQIERDEVLDDDSGLVDLPETPLGIHALFQHLRQLQQCDKQEQECREHLGQQPGPHVEDVVGGQVPEIHSGVPCQLLPNTAQLLRGQRGVDRVYGTGPKLFCRVLALVLRGPRQLVP